MKKEIIQENKARWEVFEWMGSSQSKVIWAVDAASVVIAAEIMEARGRVGQQVPDDDQDRAGDRDERRVA